MRKQLKITSTVALMATVFVASRARSQCTITAPLVPPRTSTTIARARAIVRDSMLKHGIPGVAVAISKNGVLLWEEGFGYADLEQCVPVKPTTLFRVGSVAKSLTSAAVAQLVQSGQLDLDAEVQKYVPNFPRKKWPITVRQIGGHIAGIHHYLGDDWLSAKKFESVTASLSMFQDDSLMFEPGTKYMYSSYGFNLLSAVVEGASHEQFLDYMSKHVFKPLGMEHTVPDKVDSIIVGRGRFYERNADSLPWHNGPYVDNSYKWAGGGFLSTPSDLVRFANAFLSGKLMNASTRDILWTSQKLRDGRETGYGIGWFVGKLPNGRRVVAHGGASVGGSTHLLIYPDEKIVVAVISNTSGERWIGSGKATQQIAEAFLKP